MRDTIESVKRVGRSLVRKEKQLKVRLLYPELMLRSDKLAIYPNTGILFNRIKKSANTSTSAILADVEGQSYSNAHELKKILISPHDCPPSVLRRSRHFLKLVVVRNPYDRLLSAFRQKIALRAREGNYEKYPGFGQDTPNGFREFVQSLSVNGDDFNSHWKPQHKLLALPIRDFHVIAKTETLSEDIGKFLALTNIAEDALRRLEFMHPINGHITRSNERREEYYDTRTYSKVAQIYRKDFEIFKYES